MVDCEICTVVFIINLRVQVQGNEKAYVLALLAFLRGSHKSFNNSNLNDWLDCSKSSKNEWNRIESSNRIVQKTHFVPTYNHTIMDQKIVLIVPNTETS